MRKEHIVKNDEKEEELRLKHIALEAVRRSYEMAKTELAETKQILETIVHGITDGILLISKDFKIIWANKTMLKSAGCLQEEIIGKHCYEITHKKGSSCMPPHDACPIEEVLRTGKSTTIVHTHFDKDNNERFVEVRAYPIKDKSGHVTQFIHIERDITEQKKAEKMIKDSEASYRAIFNSVNDAIIIHDINDFSIIEINKYGCEMFVCSCEEMIGMGIEKLTCGEEAYSKKALAEFFEKAAQNKPQRFEWKIKDNAGRCFFVEIDLKRALIHGRYCLINMARDITGKK